MSIILIHRWGGHPKGDWYPWLQNEVEKLGYDIEIPEMPDSEEPVISKWVDALAEYGDQIDEETIFIGHSIGCQTIMRYLDQKQVKVKGAIFVGPWFELTGLTEAEDKAIAKSWLEEPIDLDRVKELIGNLICIFSDNDYFVPLSNVDQFTKKLEAQVVLEADHGHFTEDDGVKELQVLLDRLREMAT